MNGREGVIVVPGSCAPGGGEECTVMCVESVRAGLLGG